MTTDRFDAVFADWQTRARQELDRRATTPACLAFSRLAALAEPLSPPWDEAECHHLEGCRRCRSLYQRLHRLRDRERERMRPSHPSGDPPPSR
jgi:hypothetical protein